MTRATFDLPAIVERLAVLEQEVHRLRTLLTTPAIEPSTETSYIESVSSILSGEPIVRGTRTPVRAIVERWKFGETAEEVARNLPHLRLAQVFAALSYYDDHRAEIENYIALNRVPVDD